MREILFRGKQTDNGEWIEGSLIKTFIGFQIREHKRLDWCGGFRVCDVIPETVGQYTGLTDKNGKKIFEGDIVKLFLTDGIEIGAIKFNDIMCRFMFYDKSGGYAIDDDCIFEVIGNEWDIPDLLGSEG